MLLVLVFLGQSSATMAMPCQSMAATSSGVHDMAAMDHSMVGMHHDMSHMAQPDKSSHASQAHDCCKTMEHCSSSGCSLSAVSHGVSVTALSATSPIVGAYSNRAPIAPVSSLYRPPIFR